MAIARPVTVSSVASVATNGVAGPLYPNLFEYLTAETFDDGSARKTSSILLFIEGGYWKACLNDRALSRTLWATGLDPESVLEAVNAAIASPTADWRKSQPYAGKRGK